jgi:hypothetical protein
MHSPERRLPKKLLERASLRGKEYAWRIADIPEVIEAARRAGLVNVGGQLQFRFPDGGTCECYWVEVDTYRSVPQALPWDVRVVQTAEVALADFARLASKYDFLEEGRRDFATHLKEVEERGGDPAEMMCFVWYVLDSEEAGKSERPTA